MLKKVYPPPLVVDLWLRQSAGVFLTGTYYKLNTHKNFIGFPHCTMLIMDTYASTIPWNDTVQSFLIHQNNTAIT